MVCDFSPAIYSGGSVQVGQRPSLLYLKKTRVQPILDSETGLSNILDRCKQSSQWCNQMDYTDYQANTLPKTLLYLWYLEHNLKRTAETTNSNRWKRQPTHHTYVYLEKVMVFRIVPLFFKESQFNLQNISQPTTCISK